jgi:general secretion pathway protein J
VRRPRGFTLVEVMVAVGITATMGAMTIGAFSQIDRASTGARAQAERYAAARLALSRLSREVSMAFLSNNFDDKRFQERLTRFEGREDELRFATMAHERLYPDVKESDQSVVEYTVESDPDHPGEDALFRREKPRIDDEPDRGGRKDLVADRVTSFRVQYWDPKRKDWSREWTTRTVDHADELPARVRFELETKLADGRTEKFTTEARIAMTRPLPRP